MTANEYLEIVKQNGNERVCKLIKFLQDNGYDGYAKACDIKQKCRMKFEEEFGKVELYDERRIPLSWYETYYSEDVFDPRKKRKQERTTL